MSNCSDNKNPLQHSGTSQPERLLPGLKPGYVNVNEKEYADWIVFAGEFASYLTYYDTTGNATGNWQSFFTNDVSALLGTIAVQDIDAYRRMIKDRFDFLKSHSQDADLNDAEQKFHELFSILLSLSKALDRLLALLPDKDEEQGLSIVLKTTLKNSIETKLAPALQRLLSYYNAANTAIPRLIQTGNLAALKVINMPVVPVESVLNGEGLSKSWWRNGAASWSDYKAGIATDASIFGVNPAAIRRINHAAYHNLFTSIFDQYTQVYTKIINGATADLLTTLQNWNTHPAHYALFLAFLKLFRFAQDNINTITQRHLDLYYKEVLQLLPRDAAPNKTHILVELAKMTDEYALKAGTLLKAGKDSIGKEVLYVLDKETTFNKAKVAQLKSVYKGDAGGRDDHSLPGGGTAHNEGRLFASPVTNSDDGLGAALTSAHKEWHPYVNKKFEEAQLKDIAMPNAAIGFAIASHYLYCTEGEREITIRLAASDNNKLYNQPFDCYLTTEKGWLKIDATAVSIVAGTMSNSTPCAEFTISLAGDAPAITNYVQAIHGGTFDATTPMLRMILQNADEVLYAYNDLKDVTISNIEIDIEVGDIANYSNTGLKQLLLANDFGPIDPSKPFQPFGALPAIGNRLVIGSKEVFTKKNTQVRFNIEWKDIGSFDFNTISYGTEPDGGKLPNTTIRFLRNGIWESWVDNDEIYTLTGLSINPTVAVPFSQTGLSNDTIVPFDQDYGPYNINSNKGFAAIQLLQNYGHKAFQDAQTAYLIELSKVADPTTLTKPAEPYTPVMQSLYLSYTTYVMEAVNSTDATGFENREIRFYHIYPFGDGEQRGTITNGTVSLLPQFNHTSDSAVIDHIGEFYIGIEQLRGQQAVNILFQVLEGTADPKVTKPDDHIHWSYLASNRWVAFNKKTISDATRQLVQSGIISFAIPADATTVNTILPAGFIWLRAAVSEAAEAVCKLLTIDAQAALVTYVPNANADDFLDHALPAGTVAKLKTPDPLVKKIAQPYSSFGGKPKEKESEFFVRVSERLRHKNRAITIWDYEHLVLQNFPQIYRAKCLNHTKVEDNPGTSIIDYNEVAPGYVSVITVPNLLNRNDTNPLKPYTNQNTLLEIEDFLKTKISCFVNLHVCNPQFEEVRLQFDLKLMTGFNDFIFYHNLLQQEITQFLTPWAFAEGADIQFGGKVSKSVLIDFIEERPYVDFITNVDMFQRIDDNTPEVKVLDEVIASTARSILVSAPASKHVINKVTDSSSTTSTSNCGCGSTTT